MFGNVGGLISTWSFLATDAPNFHIGNGLNLATSSIILIASICLGIWMKTSNARRDSKNVEAELDGMSEKTVEGLDWRHPGFRWRP